jgi:hypothetical protein
VTSSLPPTALTLDATGYRYSRRHTSKTLRLTYKLLPYLYSVHVPGYLLPFNLPPHRYRYYVHYYATLHARDHVCPLPFLPLSLFRSRRLKTADGEKSAGERRRAGGPESTRGPLFTSHSEDRAAAPVSFPRPKAGAVFLTGPGLARLRGPRHFPGLAHPVCIVFVTLYTLTFPLASLVLHSHFVCSFSSVFFPVDSATTSSDRAIFRTLHSCTQLR